jgi:hypothetical protein
MTNIMTSILRNHLIFGWLWLVQSLIFLGASGLCPPENDETRHLLQAVFVEVPPIVDGFLEPEIWAAAPAANRFIQKQPDEGRPATEDTEVKILYTSDHLYIGVMCFDSEPDKIIAHIKERDSTDIYENDHIRIMLDTFHDRRNGYVFVTNPQGAQLDIQVRKEGRREGGRGISNPNINTDWKAVWNVRTAILPDGWSAEIAIPLSNLRFNENSGDGWGLNIMRNIRRKNEESTWAPLPRNLSFEKISLAGTLTGLEMLEKGLNLQVKPFALAGGTRSNDPEERTSGTGNLDAGLDIKFGLTSTLTADITVNTDFSQVEADDQQINLTRFSLFYPEKRDFFLENSAMFSIGSPDDAMIFFSRRIGLSEDGEEIPLLGGVKVAGRAGRFSLGMINIQTGARGDLPSNNYSVFRVSRDILDQSSIGLLMTNRQASVSGDYGRTLSLDGDFILSPNLSLDGYLALTSSPEMNTRNTAAKLGFYWISDNWDFNGSVFSIEDNFNADMGFVRRTGIRRAKTHLGFTPKPAIPGVRRLNPHVSLAYTTDQQNALLLREKHVHFNIDLINGGNLGFQWNENHEFLDEEFLINEEITIPVGLYTDAYWQLDWNTDRSRRFYTRMSYKWGDFFRGRSRIVNLRAGFRPLPSLNGEFSLVYNDIGLPQGAFVSHLLRTRLIYGFTTRLFLMSLIQWNSTTGDVDTNLRFNFIYRPGSDIYLVYNERRPVEGLAQGIRDRSLAVKFNYLFNF